MLGTAQDCLQAAGEAQLPFRDDNGSPRLPSGSQAIITSYQFGCCGDITAWLTYVQPGGGMVRNGVYDIFFQVWRPSPAVQDDGCYSLAGENRFTSILLGDGGLVSKTPKPSNIISVRPGDVVGYYTFSRAYPDQGIQLETDYTDDIVWYLADFDTDSITLEATNCPLPVGVESNRVLTSSTNAGPVLSVRISKLLSTYLKIVLVVFTLRFNLLASVNYVHTYRSLDLKAQHKKKKIMQVILTNE